jgi:hypothetical protein
MAESRNRAFAKLAKDVTAAGNIKAEGISSDVTLGGATVYATRAALPSSGNTAGDQAFVSGNNRLYIWNGSGWYNVALLNVAPSIQSILDSDGGTTPFSLSIDGTPTTITITALDSDGDPITYAASTDSNFSGLATLSQADNVFTITPFSQDSATTSAAAITFTATDGINVASSGIQTFTLNFLSALWDETVLSIGTSSTNSLANYTIIDRSTNAHTITTNTTSGTPTQTAFHPYLDNWSVEFDGTGDYLTVPNSASLSPESGDFTFELNFYYRGEYPSGYVNVFSYGSAGNALRLFLNTNTIMVWRGSTPIITSSANAYTTHAWQHVAIAREGSTLTLYIDGVSVGSATETATFDQGQLNIGQESGQPLFTGNISNLRIVKGTAVYTSDFIPPTEKLTAITNTSLLTCQSNRFIDTSSNGHTITANGDAKVSAFNPFGQESEYIPGENKGSLYIENAGNRYISFPPEAFTGVSGTAFTLEMWVYPMQYGNDYGHLVHRNWTGSNNFLWSISPSGYFSLWFNHTGLRMDNTTHIVPLKQWNHIALGRDGNNFAFFLNGEVIQTGTYSGNIDTARSDQFYVGVYPGYNIATVSHNAYFSDLKITGSDVYGVGGSTYTVPTSPINNTNAELYLPMDNAGIFDKTGNNTLTLAGNASTSTTQTKFADTAMYFDGTGDGLEVKDNPKLFAFGTGDFTIEMWVYINAFTNQYSILYASRPVSTNGPYVLIPIENDGKVYLYTQTAVRITSSPGTITTGQWYHIALCRSGSNSKLFVDGTQVGSIYVDTNNYDNPEGRPTIGSDSYFAESGINSLNGYIENLQILKGVAKYTTNFTPPIQTQGKEYQAES